MGSPKLRIVTVLCEPFEENTYLVWLEGLSDCVVIDPGLEPNKIVQAIESRGLRPVAILNTHGHSDHIGGNGAIKDRWPDCALVIGAAEASKLTDPWGNLSAAFGVPLVSPPADVLLNDGDTYQAAAIDWLVRMVPGHTSGHVVFLCRPSNPDDDSAQGSSGADVSAHHSAPNRGGDCARVRHVFVGDVIFADSIGRTDFPDGDHAQLLSGIRSKLFILPDDTVLLPGHGLATTVGQEKRSNPFVGDAA